MTPWPTCPHTGARCFLGRACEMNDVCWLRDQAALKRDRDDSTRSTELLDRFGNDEA
jgi:hypothetical protein